MSATVDRRGNVTWLTLINNDREMLRQRIGFVDRQGTCGSWRAVGLDFETVSDGFATRAAAVRALARVAGLEDGAA